MRLRVIDHLRRSSRCMDFGFCVKRRTNFWLMGGYQSSCTIYHTKTGFNERYVPKLYDKSYKNRISQRLQKILYDESYKKVMPLKSPYVTAKLAVSHSPVKGRYTEFRVLTPPHPDPPSITVSHSPVRRDTTKLAPPTAPTRSNPLSYHSASSGRSAHMISASSPLSE